MDQHYCLRWNKHLTNLTDVLISLLEREALCDVTLSVGNNKTIKVRNDIEAYFDERSALCNSLSNTKTFIRQRLTTVHSSSQAHQAILSACSPYFESIFIENTHPHPIMYMGNVDFEDLKATIDCLFVYNRLIIINSMFRQLLNTFTKEK